MNTNSWRPIAVIIVLLTAVVYVLPTVQMTVKGLQQPTLWPKKKINLGLDLQGGMHLVLQVYMEKAVENTVNRSYDELRGFVRKNHVKIKNIRQTVGHRPVVVDGERVEPEELRRVAALFFAWVGLLAFGGLVTALLTRHGAVESASGMFSALGNIGPNTKNVGVVVDLNL